MPGWRSPDLIRDDPRLPGHLRALFWRLLTDYQFWMSSGRDAVFWGHGIGMWRALYPGELDAALHTLEKIWYTPHLVEDTRLAEACAAVWEWAEGREHLELALQFAELAARLEPDRADRAATAGRLCRRHREMPRGTTWFHRSLRQATRQKHLINKAIARLGWSALERELGYLREAEQHAIKGFRAAMRAGRRTLAASAAHELLDCYITQERWDDAMAQGQTAVAMYKTEHPRLVALAHDVAVLWLRRGYASSAVPVLEVVEQMIRRPDEKDTVLANLARAAAACGSRLQYDRAVATVRARLDADQPVPAWAIYHFAHAARNAGDWPAAETLARLALSRIPAIHRGKVKQLLNDIELRLPGDANLIPATGSEIDKSREILLRKLKRNAAAQPDTAAPPEIYPLT